MNVNSWLLCGVLTVGIGSFRAYAQAPAQPGQIALQAAVAVTDASSGAARPVQLSPTGELPSGSLLPSRKPRFQDGARAATVWKISIATMLGATAWDAASSMGKQEANPLLRSSNGTFGGKGIAIKAGLAGLSLAPQIIFRDRKDLRKLFTIANFVNTGIFVGVATHNMGIKSVQR
jgi:hypothetical protein